jgi:hypothetical protein
MIGRIALVAAVVLVGSGCGADSQPASSRSSPSMSPSTSSAPSARVAPPTDAAQPPDVPEPATAPPPRNAGPLGPANLPAPAALGAGWQVYADPGGAERGFLGNGGWTRRRSAHQAAFEALPIGCANTLPTESLPVPEHALQGTYRNRAAAPATVLALRFDSGEQATSYLTGYAARMRACGSSGSASLVVQPLWSGDDAVASLRRHTGAETYVEVVVRAGSTVALLATTAYGPDAAEPWTRATAPKLAATIDR